MTKLRQNTENYKGVLTSESSSFWFKSPEKGAKSLSWKSSLYGYSSQDSDLAPFSGDLNQNEELSGIGHLYNYQYFVSI